MCYVIKRQPDGPMDKGYKYVSPAGSRSSYTNKLQEARRFPTREAADRECCGNERVVPYNEA